MVSPKRVLYLQDKMTDISARFDVLSVLFMKITGLWAVTLCSH
jgi:hypothetical protein